MDKLDVLKEHKGIMDVLIYHKGTTLSPIACRQ
jgi:hypothetical protein